MVYLLYDLILFLAALVLVPYYFFRGLRGGKTRQGIRERMGVYAAGRLDPLAGRPVIWIHAVSVGETRAAIPLVKALREAYPGHALLLSNVTETGREVASKIPELDLCLYFPFDLSFIMGSVLGRIRPVMAVVVETEIWPNFVRQLHRRAVPVVLVNGRISDRSYPRYLRVRPLLEPILSLFSAHCMQSARDGERIRGMGAPPERVHVTGNLKFDMKAEIPSQAQCLELRRRMRLPKQVPVWVAGSTHAGEEEILCGVHRRLLEQDEPCCLVLVPRHPSRCKSLTALLDARGIPWRLRSRLDAQSPELAPGEVLVVDTLGEMLSFYALCDFVFVGGSLVPVGGHNVLEASLMGRPAVFGPHMSNFRDIARLLQEAGGGRRVADEEELLACVRQLRASPELCRGMGEKGRALLDANTGATARTMEHVRRLMGRA